MSGVYVFLVVTCSPVNPTKRIFPIAVVIFAVMTLDALAQSPSTFTVIKVSGSVYSAALNRTVQQGDKIAASDKLKFNSQKAYMHVINPGMGLKTVRDIPDDSPRELMGLLQAFVNNKSPNSSRGTPSTVIEEIRHQLEFPAMLVLGDGRIKVATEDLSLKSPAGIKAAYNVKGKEVDRVISDESGFNLGKDFVFESDVPKQLPEITITYYEDVNDRFFSSIELIGKFTPSYTDEATLAKELKVLIGILQIAGGDADSIEPHVINYLTSEYEAPIQANLRDWLSANRLLTY
jgi:hypothetical protein